jgi:hypothetical protein
LVVPGRERIIIFRLSFAVVPLLVPLPTGTEFPSVNINILSLAGNYLATLNISKMGNVRIA